MQSSFNAKNIIYPIINNNNSRMQYEKRIIQIFKIFIEKVFVPQIRKVQGNLAEWNKLSTMILSDSINIMEIQQYVDSIPSSPMIVNNYDLKQIPPNASYKREDNYGQANLLNNNFNPNKTFGGERSRTHLIKTENDQGKQFPAKDQTGKNKMIPLGSHNHQIISSLEKLYHNLMDNQHQIENIINSQQYNNNNNINTTAVFGSQDYKYI